MHKEVTGLAGKVSGWFVGVFLIFFLSFSGFWRHGELSTNDEYWLYLWSKGGFSGELRISHVHTICLFKAVLYHITTACIILFEAWMECSPPLICSTNALCSRGAGQASRCPFLLQHQYISAQDSEASQGLEGRTEPIKANWGWLQDALRCFSDDYYRK